MKKHHKFHVVEMNEKILRLWKLNAGDVCGEEIVDCWERFKTVSNKIEIDLDKRLKNLFTLLSKLL